MFGQDPPISPRSTTTARRAALASVHAMYFPASPLPSTRMSWRSMGACMLLPGVRIARNARNCSRTFESGSIPFRSFSGRLVRALHEGEQRRVRVRCGADHVVGQQELSEFLAEVGALWLDRAFTKPGRCRVRV